MSAERLSWSLLLPLVLAGCGSLAGGDYRGEVMMAIEGTVYVEDDLGLDDDIGVALLWTNGEAATDELQSVVVDTSFPARYELKLYKPPPAQTRLPLLGNEEMSASIGQIVLFFDADGDGAWDRVHEPIVGGSYDSAIVWVDDATRAQQALSGGAEADEGSGEPDVLYPEDPDEPAWAYDSVGWTPRAGFQLVDVPVPPACGLPLDSILFERPDNRAILHVGALRNTWYDWDCDGITGYDEWDYENVESGSDDIPPDAPEPLEWEGGECGPTEYLVGDCEFLATLLDDDEYWAWLDEPYVLFDPYWLECMAEQCPDLVTAFETRIDTGGETGTGTATVP